MAQNVGAIETPLTTKIFKYWLPVLFMLGVMYYFSTDVFSGENTRGALEWILQQFWPAGITHLSRFNFVVRKTMHFAEYALLAGLAYRAFRADSPVRWRLLWACYTFALIVSWALLDEFHQAQTHKRGGSIYDSMIDSAGGLTMLLLIALASHRRAPVKDQESTANNRADRAS